MGFLVGIGSTSFGGQTSLLPNGSFEFWAHYGRECLPQMLAAGPQFDSDDPLIPVRWEWRMRKPGALTRATDAHGGQYAVRFSTPHARESGTLSLSYLELAPGAVYTYGVWAKGRGRVAVKVPGQAMEGQQLLASTNGLATNVWTHIVGQFAAPGHIRKVALVIEISGDADMLLDDAHISAVLDQPYDADAVLSRKAAKDADTLVYADFEQDVPEIKLSGKAHLTADGTGRFGRALRVDKPDQAMIPFVLPAMPAEGTIECWLSPDAVPQIVKETWNTQYHFLSVHSSGQNLGRLMAATDSTLSWGWRMDGELYGKYQRLGTANAISLQRMRKDQWTHVAISWDPTAWRIYVDGVLADMKTDGPMKWWDAPVSLLIGAEVDHCCWSGMIDEIRVSKVRRYGPMVPQGVTFIPFPPPVVAVTPVAPRKLDPPKVDATAERAKLLGALPAPAPGAFESKPNAAGEYVYEVTSAKPLVAGYDFTLETNKHVKGLSSANIPSTRVRIGLPDNGGAHWKLGAIQPGPYWVGLVYHSGGAKTEAPANPAGHAIYLNGRIIQCDKLGEPVQIAPGVWFSEMQSQVAEVLKPGDDVAVLAPPGWTLRVARVILYPQAPALGAFRWPINFGGHWWNLYTALGVNTEVRFLTTGGGSADFNDQWWAQEQKAESPDSLLRGTAGHALAQCVIANPLSVPVTVDYICVIKGYYGQEAGRDAQRLTVAPHTRVVREVPFAVTPDDPGYFAEATVKAVDAPQLGWPEGDMAAYFPGYRQSVRWPDPFHYRDTRRLFFAGPVKDLHRTILLNGQWNLAYTTSLNPPMPQPADLPVKPMRVPKPYHTDSLDNITPRPHGGYFSRSFTLPEDAAAGTIRLVVSEVKCEATAYVNGQKVGNVYGESTPLIADITRAVKPGTNELVLVVRDLIAIMDPAYVNPANPVASPDYLDAPGLHGKIGLEVGSVSLEMSPAVAADDILVQTSVRQKTIGARLSVVSHQTAPVKARVKATVFEARKALFDLGEQTVELAPDRPVSLTFNQPWKNPRLWSSTDPHLYELAVEVTDAATGTRLDLARTRFGFRESWIVGPKVYFNGIPVKFKSTTNPTTLGTRDDFQLCRGANAVEYMDEFGYLGYQMITGVYNTPSRHNVEHEPFWANARSNLLLRAQRLQNHPSILAWDLSNEWLCYLFYTSSDTMLGAKRMMTLTDTIRKQDPTRWTLYNSDGDLRGLLDNAAWHYMAPYGVNRMRGHSNYFPDGAFWRELHQDFEPGKPIPASTGSETLFKPYEKVIMDTEYLWKVGGLMPPGLSRYVGEDDVLSPAIDSGAGPIAWFWKQCLDGHRDLGTTAIGFYAGHTGAARRGYQLQTFIMPDLVHHGFSGRTLRWKYALLNDLFVPAELAFSWRLVAPGGKTAAKGRDVRKMSTGDLQRGELSLKLPKVSTRTKYTLHLRLESDGQFVNAEERDIDVFPNVALAAGRLERKVLLFEGDGNRTSNAQHPTPNIQRGQIQESTANALMAAGVVFESVRDLPSLTARPSTLAPSSLLIIAEGALDTTNAAAVAKLDSFVAAGGRVLILAQTVTPEGLPVATKLEAREWASQTFVRSPQHPIFSGSSPISKLQSPITSWDLHFWAPDRVVGQGAYTKPEGGAAVALVDSGAITGQEWVQLMEVYRGKGRYLLCQLPLVAKYDVEPMARELLARLVRYMAGEPAFLEPTRRLTVLAEKGSLIVSRIEAIGAHHAVMEAEGVRRLSESALLAAPGRAVAGSETRPTDLRAGVTATVLADAAVVRALSPSNRVTLAQVLSAGATVIIADATPADTTWLSALAGGPVQITVPRYHMWGGRGYRTGSGLLTAGLSQLDLYWKRYEGAESAASQAEFPELTIEPLQNWSAQATGASEHVFPGALLTLPVGKGQLVLDQRRWFTIHEKLGTLANRNLSALLLGVGVELAPVVRLRELPQAVAYKPIDLTPFANRALADDLAEDGMGGWTDQGPKGDLRAFPTGRQSFGGVPFTIGVAPKSCIVLSSTARPLPETLPAEVTIPIGYPAEGFYVLHAAAYGGEEAALYQVQYADGTTVDVPVTYGINMHDWTTPGPFIREKGTRSMVAWTGSCPMFPLIGVYRMLWVNPKPSVPVKAVRFANPTLKAVPILLGLTVAVAKDAQAKAPDALARAQALLAQASQAAAAKDDTTAETLLKEARALDPTLTAAHQGLADVYGRKGDENAALAAYQAWANAGAATPLPYNRIGEILERRKDYKGALEAYTKSLEIEWNQPPAIEAKARLAKQVSP
jgi:hypothetical protein